MLFLFFNMGLSHQFWIYFSFFLEYCKLEIDNFHIGNFTFGKPKSHPGFKPGLPRQNAISLPLVPPPLPLRLTICLYNRVYLFWQNTNADNLIFLRTKISLGFEPTSHGRRTEIWSTTPSSTSRCARCSTATSRSSPGRSRRPTKGPRSSVLLLKR